MNLQLNSFTIKYIGGVLNHKFSSVCRYLSVSGRTYGRPITGQTEVIGDTNLLPSQLIAQWQTMEGVYYHTEDAKPRQKGHEHTEL